MLAVQCIQNSSLSKKKKQRNTIHTAVVQEASPSWEHFPQGCSDHYDMGWVYITLSMDVMFPNLIATWLGKNTNLKTL